MIIDFHTHVFPDGLQWLQKRLPAAAAGILPLTLLRRRLRTLVRPAQHGVHRAQPILRLIPRKIRESLDQIGGVTALPSLLIESTPADLIEAMEDSNISRALIIAHPPYASNEFILETARSHHDLIPVVNIPKDTARPGAKLKSYVAKGAKALKIHAAADGEGADSKRYHALLEVAAELHLPVILHTGEIHNAIFYRDPEQGRAERFSDWFSRYRSVKFILAHMNFHDPRTALETAEALDNVFVDTSWQPIEAVVEAVRRIGASRVLFGTDWPLVGDNISVHLDRIQDGIRRELLTEEDGKKILGENAARILKLGGVDGL